MLAPVRLLLLGGSVLLLFGQTAASAQSDTTARPELRKLLNRGNTVDSVAIKPDSTYWRNKLEAGVNLNQGSFSDNWKGGGVNSIAFGLSFNGRLAYRRNRFSWTVKTQLRYGIVKNAQQALRKSSDRLFFDAKAGYLISTRWQWFGSFNVSVAVWSRL